MSPRGRCRRCGTASWQTYQALKAWVPTTRATSAGSESTTALPPAGDAGVAHDDVEVAHGLDGLGHQPPALLEVVDRGADRHGPAAQALDGGHDLGGGVRLLAGS